MMNENEAKTVLLLLNTEIAKVENREDYLSKHDLDVLLKLKKNLTSTFTTL